MQRRPQSHDRQRPLHDNGEEIQERVLHYADVTEAEKDTWTGLYDADGHKLHRPRETIGYKIR